MTTVQNRRGQSGEAPRRNWGARLPYIVLVGCMALFAYAFIQRVQEVRGLQADQAALQLQNKQTEQRIKALRRTVRYERTAAYIMNAARSTWGYTLPNEVSINANPHYLHPQVRAAPAPTPTPGPSWKVWWESLTRRS